MTNQKERQTPSREFTITRKTTWAVLTRDYSGGGKNDIWGKVAKDILANAEELEEGLDWEEIQKGLFANLLITNSLGKSAIAHTIARPVAIIAVNMGWNMDSPEIVYISGFYFYQRFKSRADSLEKQHENLTERKFLTDEDRQKTSVQERLEAERAKADSQKLKNALDEYADQSLPQDPAYLSVIQSLLYLHGSISDRRERVRILKDVLGLLKDDDLLSCLELIWRCTS